MRGATQTSFQRLNRIPELAGIAREFGLFASRGSDFHSPDESRVDLGDLPDLPGTLTPVWEALAPRIQGRRPEAIARCLT